MKNVLLVTSPDAEAPKALAYALERAKETGGELVALAVLDPEVVRRLETTLAQVGFVGEKVSDRVVETVLREKRARAEAHLRQVAETATKEGVRCRVLVEQGDPSEICGRVIRSEGIGLAVLVAEKPSWLTRLLARSTAVPLPSLAGCEVKVMDE
ncbi:MAG: hypothetical protein KatS3mg076_1782 [Candidatus Binatia bacterium]|nr:MAG: hypothetical protein KatS3mg076_1782 [Candidatus Binatia bacterium]